MSVGDELRRDEPDRDDPDSDGYTGPATVTVGQRRPVEVAVQLIGHFDPIAGKFVWQGRIRGLAAASDPADPPVAEGTTVRVQTPRGSGDGVLSAQDVFGGHIVTGVGPPPFPQLPGDVEP